MRKFSLLLEIELVLCSLFSLLQVRYLFALFSSGAKRLRMLNGMKSEYFLRIVHN